MAESTPYRGPDSDAVTILLRSDPPWLWTGLLAVTLGSVGLFMLYFLLITPHPSLTLALLPGLVIATFAGSWLAWWGRRRGGTLRLEASRTRIALERPNQRRNLLDPTVPFGALIVRDTATPRRILLLSQDSEPVMVLDTGTITPSTGVWSDRTIDVDLSAVALSPASQHVLTTAMRQSIDPLLALLGSELTETSPLLVFPTSSGDRLWVFRDEIRLGERAVSRGSHTVARRITIQHSHGEIAACAITTGETTLLLACQSATENIEGSPPSEAPDVYLPPVLFTVILGLFGASSTLQPGSPPAESYDRSAV